MSEAEAIAQRVGDRGAAAHAKVRLIFLDIHTNPDASHKSVRADLEGAIRVFEALGDKSGLARALHLAAMLLMWGGQNARAREEMEQAARHAREVGDRALEIDALSGIVMTVVYGPEPVATALQRLEEIERDSQGARRLQAVALRGQAGLLAMVGSFDTARELILTADRIVVELGLETLRAAGILRMAGQIESMAGDAAAAEKLLRTAYDSLYRAKDWGHLASVAPLLAEALLAQGQQDEAEQLLELTSGCIIADDAEGQVSPRGRAVEAGGAARRRSRCRGVRARRRRPVGDRR